MQAYPFSMFIIFYGAVMGLFVTVLMLFHVSLITEFKSTQEKLKKDKGMTADKFTNAPFSYQSILKNWIKTLCSRRNKYKSKISWELYKWSTGNIEALNEFWTAQEKREKEFTRINKIEKSVEIYDPPKSNRSKYDE
jgi:uncharacterized membrane protein YeiB